MGSKRITREKIIDAFLFCAFDKSAGETSLQDIAKYLSIQKASLYNHFSSKEEMYAATIDYCRISLDSIKFLADELITDNKIYNEEPFEAFNKILKRYIQIYESEPVFQMYSFVYSEQFFNGKAVKIIDSEFFKIKSGILELMKGFGEINKLNLPELELLRLHANCFASAICLQIEKYITNKKEIIRQNPECGVGSLFALPTDTSALENIYKISEHFLSILKN